MPRLITEKSALTLFQAAAEGIPLMRTGSAGSDSVLLELLEL